MRLGEVCAVEVGDVDLQAQKLRLDETKNGESRDVALSKRAVEILGPLIEAAEALKRKGLMPSGKDVMGLRYRQLRKLAGLGGLRFHDTRHTAATNARKHLDSILDLKAFTGHKSTRSLERYYHADISDIARRLG
jgi:integrase